MDATFLAVSRLWEQHYSQRAIARALKISEPKVRKILITVGAISTAESRLYAAGHSLQEIAAITGKTVHAVSARVPYTKCSYNAEYPSLNALRIRESRAKNADSGK